MEIVPPALAVASLMVPLAACSTIAQGTSQELEIRTQPFGAQCQVLREGRVIATLPTTPGTVTVTREGEPIEITCKKEQYDEGGMVVSSDVAAAFWYNFYWLLPLITAPAALVGSVVDLSTGAYHHYDSPVEMILLPQGQPSVVP